MESAGICRTEDCELRTVVLFAQRSLSACGSSQLWVSPRGQWLSCEENQWPVLLGPRKPNQGRLSHVRILQIRDDSRCHEWGHGRVIPGARRSEGARRSCRRQPDGLISKWMRILGWNWFADGGLKEQHQKNTRIDIAPPTVSTCFQVTVQLDTSVLIVAEPGLQPQPLPCAVAF